MTVHSVADFLCINRSYLHRLFKSAVGVSIKDYLLNFRIKRACDMLVHTQLPVATISRSVGYEDPLYFSRLFKKKKSMSPKEYRETHSKERDDRRISSDERADESVDHELTADLGSG